MRKDELFSGAPVLRGRWSAYFWLLLAGYLTGRTQPITALLNPDDSLFTPFGDAVSLVLSVLCIIAGTLALDQYGRNCWFAWAPDDVKWGKKIGRDDVNRRTVLAWRHRR